MTSTAEKPADNVVPLRKGKKQGNQVAVPHQPTEREKQSLAAYQAKKADAKPLPPIKTKVSGKNCTVRIDHPDPAMGFVLMLEATGGASAPFLEGLLDQAALVSQQGGQISDSRMNYVLSVIHGLEPQDQMEAMLGAQMAAVQIATMNAAYRMNATAGDLAKWEAYERSFNRLARTFAAQVEALKRYRSKGEQRVYVERVNVESGGQAVVGNVTTGGRVAGGAE